MKTAHLLVHFFFPHHSNNHKPKLLHTSTLSLLSLFLLTYQIVLQILPSTGLKVLGYAANISPVEVVRLTNEKRNEVGLSSLEFNATLSAAALAKGKDMLEKGYWAHVSPDGTQPWKFFSDVGYKYRYAGENLARDFSNPNSAVDAWMVSPSHRDNMLSAKYSDIGVAVVEGNLDGVDTTVIVQLFGTPYVDTVPAQPVADAQQQLAAADVQIQTTPSPLPEPTAPPEEPSEIALVLNTVPEDTKIYSAPTILPTPTTQVANYFKVSPFGTTRGLSLLTVTLLLAVLIIDGVVTSRRRIYRIGGRTLGHIAFMGMVFAVVLVLRAGRVL